VFFSTAAAAIVALTLIAAPTETAAARNVGAGELVLSAPLTHSDWMTHADAPAWGCEGIRTMLERCKAFGFRRIYWRVFDAGRPMCASKLLEPMTYDTSPEPQRTEIMKTMREAAEGMR